MCGVFRVTSPVHSAFGTLVHLTRSTAWHSLSARPVTRGKVEWSMVFPVLARPCATRCCVARDMRCPRSTEARQRQPKSCPTCGVDCTCEDVYELQHISLGGKYNGVNVKHDRTRTRAYECMPPRLPDAAWGRGRLGRATLGIPFELSPPSILDHTVDPVESSI